MSQQRLRPLAESSRKGPGQRPCSVARACLNPACGRSQSCTGFLAASASRCLRYVAVIRVASMGSFRKRLLVLIIGLVVVTQTVTLAAVLASTAHTVEGRAAAELRSG